MKVLEYLHSRAAQRASYAFLLLSMLLLVLGYPILQDFGVHAPLLVTGLFVFVLIGCLAAAIESTSVLTLLLVGAIILEIVAGVFSLGGPGPNSAPQYIARAAVLFFTAVILLRDVLRSPSVDLNSILGAVCVYVLLGLVGSDLYALLLYLDSEALVVPAQLLNESLDPRETLSLTTYYSFVTMTTLGFGDVSPVSATARAMTTMQAVAGQFYIAVIVARLVALHVSSAAAKQLSNAVAQQRSTSPDA